MLSEQLLNDNTKALGLSHQELSTMDTITQGERTGTVLPDTKEQEQEQVNPLMLSAFIARR